MAFNSLEKVRTAISEGQASIKSAVTLGVISLFVALAALLITIARGK